MVGTSKDGYITIETESWLRTSRNSWNLCITVETESWLELQETGICITVETESWLELQETDVSQNKQNDGWNFKRRMYHSTNRIMVGTSRDKNVSQYKQNHGWNFKEQGYITVEAESWLELQEDECITLETESWLELQGTGIYHSRSRIMVGTSRDRNISQ